MITYIIKTILCSALLIVIYYLLLEKEKMHRFNRFYLLFSIAFSFIIPLITITTKLVAIPITESINLTNSSIQSTVRQQIPPSVSETYTLPDILLLVYLMITAILLCRFIINLSILFFKIRSNVSIRYLDAKLVLTKDHKVPHSFMKYVFIHFEDFENGSIEKEILGHELTHVKQFHSIDILLIEFIMVFAWINPVLFIYKKAVQLNHEFLADEFVVKTFENTLGYQLLLLNNARQSNNLVLESPFNYLLTKKRIIMMSKKSSLKAAILKQIALIPVIVVAGYLFSTKTFAQDITNIPQEQIASTQNGVSHELLKEYQDIIKKCNVKRTLMDGTETYSLKVSDSDKERLEKIFFQMNKEQQEVQMFKFVSNSSMVLPRIIPTKDQLESFKDPKVYGVWIDEKRVSNDELNTYSSNDFAYVSESKLEKNATNYGKHVYQVNLMTNDGYQKYYNETTSRKGNTLIPNVIKKSTTDTWWSVTAKKHGFNYDSYTKYGEIVVLGEKTINNNIESYNDVVALSGGIDNNGKGNDVIVIIHAETASYNTLEKELYFYNCKVEEWPLDSFHNEPIKSYPLKIFGVDISPELTKLSVR